MDEHQLLTVLNMATSFSNCEQQLYEFITQQLSLYKLNLDSPQNIAYRLAGLLTAPIFASIPESNSYVRILSLAAELELEADPDEDQDMKWRLVLDLASSIHQGTDSPVDRM